MKLEKLLNSYLPEGADLLFVTKFGSHLYGTDTEDSDVDYKGVYMPSTEQLCLGTYRKSINNNRKKAEGERNTSADTDFELYSLHYFLELACAGETAALDMLHAFTDHPSSVVCLTSGVWDDIQAQRHMFYTRNLRAFVGYARKQAAKYGIKGSRLAVAGEVIKLLADYEDHTQKMKVVWDKLPQNEHAYYIEDNPSGIRQYQICGKIIQDTVKLSYAQEILLRYHQEYGERARRAERNEGIDWKAVSHAMRAAYQLQEVLNESTITYPLAEAAFLRDVKLGKLDYKTQVGPKLEALMDEVEALSEASMYPEEVDREYWNSFLVDATLNKIKRSGYV